MIEGLKDIGWRYAGLNESGRKKEKPIQQIIVHKKN